MIKYTFILTFYFLSIISLLSCQSNKEIRNQIYFNDFEQKNTVGMSSPKLITFNQSVVLGNYNQGGFSLKLDNLPSHDLVEISLDLYIHDSWDGNKLSDGIDGPDIWSMLLDNNLFINTSFSNTTCFSAFCSPQSYPNNYPNNNNNPKNGATNKDLPGLCSKAGVNGGTTLYQIKRTIPHYSQSLQLQCVDKLIQTNVTDPTCDESWSIDNLKLTLISVN